MKKLILLSLLFLAACTTPEKPGQAVYIATNDYAVALRIEIAYDKLPLCGQATSPKLCSDSSIRKKVRAADEKAWAALEAAKTAVRVPGFGQDYIATTLASATAATKLFVDLTTPLKVQ